MFLPIQTKAIKWEIEHVSEVMQLFGMEKQHTQIKIASTLGCVNNALI